MINIVQTNPQQKQLSLASIFDKNDPSYIFNRKDILSGFDQTSLDMENKRLELGVSRLEEFWK